MKFNRYQWYIILSGLAWSTLGVFTQLLSNYGVDLFSQVWWRLVFGILGSLAFCFIYGHKLIIRRKEIGLLLINAIIIVLGYTTFPLSIHFGVPIGRAIIILYLYPMLTIPLSYVLLGDRPTRRNFVAIIVMLISTMILFRFWEVGISGISFGDLMALLCSAVGATMTVWGAKIKRVSSLETGTTLLYTFILSLPILGIFGFGLNLLGIDLFIPYISFDLGMAWYYLLGIGLIPTVVSVGLLYAGSKHVKPNAVGVLMSIEPLAVIILGWLLFGQVLDWSTLVGGAGILLTILLL